MRLEHRLVGGYVRYISPHIIIITEDPKLSLELSDISMPIILEYNVQQILHFQKNIVIGIGTCHDWTCLRNHCFSQYSERNLCQETWKTEVKDEEKHGKYPQTNKRI